MHVLAPHDFNNTEMGGYKQSVFSLQLTVQSEPDAEPTSSQESVQPFLRC